MKRAYDIAIIGGGVIGASVAWNLSRKDAGDVVILEQESQPGSGSTSKANGGIRAQFTTDINIRMSLLSQDILDILARDIGDPPVYQPAGYLFFTNSEKKAEAMQKAVAFQRERGVTVEFLDRDSIASHAPWLETNDLLGGTFGARDGFIDPGGLCNWYIRRAVEKGVQLKTDTRVQGIYRQHGSFSLTTNRGRLRASQVVICGGAHSGAILNLIDIDLPIHPVRRHLFMTGATDTLPRVIPMTIDADSGILIRREGPAVLIAWSNNDEPHGFNEGFDASLLERFAEPLISRFPAVAEAGIDYARSWSGHYAVTPDHHAVVGELRRVPGLFVAAGFSGHGVMHAPATGKCLSEIILTGHCDAVDLHPLRPSRFAEDDLQHEMMVL